MAIVPMAALLSFFLISASPDPSLPPAAPVSSPINQASNPPPPSVSNPTESKPAPPPNDRLASILVKSEVLITREKPLPDGAILRIKILKTRMKYPLVRTEEKILKKSAEDPGEVLSTQSMVADHLIVKIVPSMAGASFEKFLAAQKAKVRKKMLSPDTYLVSFDGTDPDKFTLFLAELQRATQVIQHAEPDYVVNPLLHPNDPLFPQLWGLSNIGQNGGTPGADIHAPAAWDIATGSQKVKIGVIDTGIDYLHPDLAPNIWTNPFEVPDNGIDDDGNGFVDDLHGWDFYTQDADPMDDYFHGTHCAGLAGAAGNNSLGVVGVCWNVSLVPIKFISGDGLGYISDAIDAIRYATRLGVDVTSNSWGGGGYTQELKDAIDEAGALGILFVSSAGNYQQNADLNPQYPAGYACENIISVASSDSNDQLAWYSNYGLTSVDVAAPGVDNWSTLPTQITPAMTGRNLPSGYGTLTGTSMAVPHVSGLCALIKGIAPDWKGPQIKAVILNSVDPLPSLAGRCVSGGRINAHRALKAALPLEKPLFLIATAASSTEVNLAWTDPSEREKGFILQRRTESSPEFKEIARLSADATQYHDTQLSPETTCIYRIQTHDEYQTSPWSDEAQTTTLPLPPGPPENLQARALSSSEIELSWSEPSGDETEFLVERRMGEDDEFNLLVILPASSNTHVDSQLAPDTPCTYRVLSRNAGGLSPPSREASARTFSGIPLPPAQPQAQAVSPHEILLSWVDISENENGFIIERQLSGRPEFIPIAEAPANAVSWKDDNLLPENFYTYRIRAFNSLGESDPSPIVSAITPGIPRIPKAPTLLTVESPSPSLVNLTWSDSSDNETSFVIERKSLTHPVFTQIAQIPANQTHYPDTQVIMGIAYSYRVAAVNSTGTSDYSNIATITPAPATVMGALSAGDFHSMALRQDGTVWTWGSNAHGQLGQSGMPHSPTPLRVHGVDNVMEVAAGAFHSVCLKLDGTIWTWGNNHAGQLGDGTFTRQEKPASIRDIPGKAHAIGAGPDYTLGLMEDGTAWVWGLLNPSDKNPKATPSQKPNRPIQILGFTQPVTDIHAGTTRVTALQADGTVWTWETSPLSSKNSDLKHPAVKIAGLNQVIRAISGKESLLALKADGTLWQWNALDKNPPVEIRGFSSPIIDMATGHHHFMASLADGSLWTWGLNHQGELGNGTRDSIPYPSRVTGNIPLGIIAIAAGDEHSLSLGMDGTLYSWGSNAHGQLGYKLPAFSLLPQPVPGLDLIPDL